MRGIVVCVNYSDLLKITLPRNARHLSEVLVVTHPDDEATQAVVKTVANAAVFATDAFYRHGAHFNKGLAMEEGFEVLGRRGWTLIHDADVILPDDLRLDIGLRPGYLYGMRRRLLHDPGLWRPELDWSKCPISADRVIAGYFQLFDASHPCMQKQPWYDVTFAHAGGCDGYFQSRWGYDKKVWLPTYCLHLGERDQNWWGRATWSLDGQPPAVNQAAMNRYLASKGWHGKRGPKVDEHVEVPGHTPTGYVP